MFQEDFLTDNSERAQEVRRNGGQTRQLTNREATQQEMDRQHALSGRSGESQADQNNNDRLGQMNARQNEPIAAPTPRLDAFKSRQESPQAQQDSPERDLADWMRGISASKDAANQAASEAYTASQTNSKGAETESYSLSPPEIPSTGGSPSQPDNGSVPQMHTMVMDICVEGVAKKIRVYVDGEPY